MDHLRWSCLQCRLQKEMNHTTMEMSTHDLSRLAEPHCQAAIHHLHSEPSAQPTGAHRRGAHFSPSISQPTRVMMDSPTWGVPRTQQGDHLPGACWFTNTTSRCLISEHCATPRSADKCFPPARLFAGHMCCPGDGTLAEQ